jgi:hypothetical protein
MELIDLDSDLMTVDKTARVLHVQIFWVHGRRLQLWDVRINYNQCVEFLGRHAGGHMDLIDSDLMTADRTTRVLHVPTFWVYGRRLQCGDVRINYKYCVEFLGT